MAEGDELFFLFIPKPGDWLNMNRRANQHWGASKKTKDIWKQATWARGTGAGLARRGSLPPAVLHITLQFPTQRVRDPHNFQPTLKVIVDYLVKGFELWPDDNPMWLSQPEPVIRARKGLVEGVVIKAIERGVPDDQLI